MKVFLVETYILQKVIYKTWSESEIYERNDVFTTETEQIVSETERKKNITIIKLEAETTYMFLQLLEIIICI